MVGDGFPVNVERREMSRGGRQGRGMRVVRMTMASRVGRDRFGNGESSCSGDVSLEELHDVG